MKPVAYSERLIAFIDVLGFRQLISQSESHEHERQIVRRVSDAVLWSKEELEELCAGGRSPVFTQFSDSFVVSIGARHEERGRFGFELFALAIMNIVHCFLGSGMLLRGGITLGMLVHDQDLLFGPAMNRAYDLESRVAQYPRIILDPNMSINSSLISPPVFCLDKDGLSYFDYFTPQCRFYLVPGRLLSIQRAVEAMPLTLQLQAKRDWMVGKYNLAVERFSYPEFKARLDDYVADCDCNRAVQEDHHKLLSDAEKIRRL